MMSNFVRNGLMALGIATVSLGGVMVSEPAQAQIIADGDIDEYGIYAPVLDYGDVGPVVRDVQLFLEEEGFYDGPIDGVYGSLTRAAVMELQQDEELYPDGIVGPKTWAAMKVEEDEIF